jgi:dethiobiotin synthetase
MSVLVITGTDTGVGKTIVTAAFAALAQARGEHVAVVKPAQTGVAPNEPGDVDEVRRLTGITDVHELARYRAPLAPATAARLSHVEPPKVAELAARIELLSDRDLVLVEGAGGLLVHLDADGGTIADLALALDGPVLVVARPTLGTLNHTALTCHEVRSRGLDCAGVVIGAWPYQPDLAATRNLDDLPLYAQAPLFGALPERASALQPDAFLHMARQQLLEEIPA